MTQSFEVKAMDKKILIAAVMIIAMVLVSVALVAYGINVASAQQLRTGQKGWQGFMQISENSDGTKPWLFRERERLRIWCMRWPPSLMDFEISKEFNETVVNIAKSDEDVAKLFEDGYSLRCVIPVIKATIGGDGTVTIKATGAILKLFKEGAGSAVVKVDIETGEVTNIQIFTVVTKTKT